MCAQWCLAVSMTTSHPIHIEADELSRQALTLAVVCVERHVDTLRMEWRGLSTRQRDAMPGLEDQIARARASLRWLEARRHEVYR